MKKISMLLVLLASISLFGCGGGDEVSGRSMRSAYRSVNHIKRRLGNEQRIEFEMSFWMLRDEIRNKEDFLDEVGGNTAEELIAKGKALFEKRKGEGYEEYKDFTNWDQMITHYAQKRLDQNKRKKQDPKDKQNNVLYKL